MGRGFGESVVLHLGDGRWVVIDSLLNEAGRAAPLEYLEAIGVDVERSLELVLITHWHADHIGGVSQLLERSPTAKLALPASFDIDKFSEFMSATLKAKNLTAQQLGELAKVGALFADRRRPPPMYTSGVKPLVALPGRAASHGQDVALTALSPSDRDQQYFYQRLTGLRAGKGAARPMAFKENDNSVATWLALGADAVLLGADLETVRAADRGWLAVLNSTLRPDGVASVYKVAHHGSRTGHHDRIWSELLVTDPLVIVAPWSPSDALPKAEDKKRILRLAPRSYITAPVATRKYQAQAGEDKTLASLGIKVSGTNRLVGAVRLRKPINSPASAWHIELINGATHLNQFVARS